MKRRIIKQSFILVLPLTPTLFVLDGLSSSYRGRVRTVLVQCYCRKKLNNFMRLARDCSSVPRYPPGRAVRIVLFSPASLKDKTRVPGKTLQCLVESKNKKAFSQFSDLGYKSNGRKIFPVHFCKKPKFGVLIIITFFRRGQSSSISLFGQDKRDSLTFYPWLFVGRNKRWSYLALPSSQNARSPACGWSRVCRVSRPLWPSPQSACYSSRRSWRGNHQ